jgi:glycosyl transferase family 25
VSRLIGEVGYLRLQDERRARSKPVMQCGAFQLQRYTKLPHCAMCYAITPGVAKRLLALSQVFAAPVDVVMKYVWELDNPLYCLTPYTVSSGPHSYDSIIGHRSKAGKSLCVRVKRTLLKLRRLHLLLRFNLRHSDAELRRRCASILT